MFIISKKIFFVLSIIIITKANIIAQVGIGTEKPNPISINNVVLDVNGKTILRDVRTDTTSSVLRSLGIDQNGLVVKMPNTPTRITYLQSANTLKYEGEDVNLLNSGGLFVVPWDDSDNTINHLVTANKEENSFSFIDSGIYSITGTLNVGIRMPSGFVPTITDRVAMNVTIQYSRKGEDLWHDLTNSRFIYTAGLLIDEYTSVTIATPSALFNFEIGDKIRMIIRKPFGSILNNFEISKPTGSTISKQLVISIPL